MRNNERSVSKPGRKKRGSDKLKSKKKWKKCKSAASLRKLTDLKRRMARVPWSIDWRSQLRLSTKKTISEMLTNSWPTRRDSWSRREQERSKEDSKRSKKSRGWRKKLLKWTNDLCKSCSKGRRGSKKKNRWKKCRIPLEGRRVLMLAKTSSWLKLARLSIRWLHDLKNQRAWLPVRSPSDRLRRSMKPSSQRSIKTLRSYFRIETRGSTRTWMLIINRSHFQPRPPKPALSLDKMEVELLHKPPNSRTSMRLRDRTNTYFRNSTRTLT